MALPIQTKTEYGEQNYKLWKSQYNEESFSLVMEIHQQINNLFINPANLTKQTKLQIPRT